MCVCVWRGPADVSVRACVTDTPCRADPASRTLQDGRCCRTLSRRHVAVTHAHSQLRTPRGARAMTSRDSFTDNFVLQ